jgi:hypothetical protein
MHVLVHGDAVAVDTVRDANYIPLKANKKKKQSFLVMLIYWFQEVRLIYILFSSSSSTNPHELVSSLFQLHSHNLFPYNIVSFSLVTNWKFCESFSAHSVKIV